MSAKKPQYRGPTAIYEKDYNYVFNMKYDWTDPCNPKKNNIVLVPCKAAIKNGTWQCQVVPAAVTTINPNVIWRWPTFKVARAMVSPHGNIKDDYPNAPVSMLWEGNDPSKIQMSVMLSPEPYHPDQINPDEPDAPLSDYTKCLQVSDSLHRWVIAYLLTDASMKFPKFHEYKHLQGKARIDACMENSADTFYYERIGTVPRMTPVEKKQLPLAPGAGRVTFSHSCFQKLPKDKRAVERLRERLEESDAFAVDMWEQHQHYFKPIPVCRPVETEDGTLEYVPLTYPTEVAEAITEGGLVTIETALKFAVTSKSFLKFSSGIKNIIYWGEAPLQHMMYQTPVSKNLKMDLAAAGISIPRLRVTVDESGREVKTLEEQPLLQVEYPPSDAEEEADLDLPSANPVDPAAEGVQDKTAEEEQPSTEQEKEEPPAAAADESMGGAETTENGQDEEESVDDYPRKKARRRQK